MTANLQEKVIFDFNEKASVRQWNIVNDGVMGGLSASSMQWREDGVAVFSGSVSLENNGGFASTRAILEGVNLAGFSSVALRVKGDGKTYKFRIRTDRNFDGVTYSCDFFAPAGEWKEIRLPFSEFVPVFRGRRLANVGPLRSEEIRQTGFLISDKQSGSFSLEVDWIKAVE